ncbi:hypothetical protein ACLOJK_014531, partial [Asimina triloba]
RQSEFFHLSQGQMTIEEYDLKFQSLIRFVPWAQADPQAAANKFQEGLRPSIRRTVSVFNFTEYSDMRNMACTLEKLTLRLRRRPLLPTHLKIVGPQRLKL